MKLRFTPRALRNLAEIADYLGARNPTAAVRVTDAIEHRLRNLLHFPYSGRAQKDAGVRKLVIPRYRYLVYYYVDEDADEVVVLNVKHPARRPDYEDA